MSISCGISMCLFGDAELELSLRQVAAGGFRQVELSCSRPRQLAALKRDPEAVRALLAELGLTAPVGHSPCTSVNAGAVHEDERRASVAEIASVFEPLARAGARCVVVHPNADLVDYCIPRIKRATRPQTLRSLSELAARAAECGLRMAVENLQFWDARYLGRPGCSMADLLSIIDGLGDHVGLCLDTGHARLNGLDPAAEARVGGARIFTMHIHDTDGKSDPHWIPGRGVIDWRAFDDALREIEFGGVPILEIEAVPGQESSETLRLAYAAAESRFR